MTVASPPHPPVSGSLSGTAPRRGTRRRRPRWNSAWLFMAPSLILIAVFILEPILQTGWMSLHEWTIGEDSHKWLGLANYHRLFDDHRFWNALGVTVEYTLAVTVLQVGLALGLAVRLRRTTWFTTFVRGAFFFPAVASLAVTGVIWHFLLDPQIGLVDAWLGKLHLGSYDFLQSEALALPTLIAVGVWKYVGFSMIVLLAGLQEIPEHLYEAATLDGAGRLSRLRHVTLPGLRQTLLFTIVIATINGLQLFDVVYTMTGGGPVFHTESIVMYLYQQGFVYFDLGYASALAWVLFLIILAVSAVQLRVLRVNDVD
jgi:ABC-type sugar transport system permease subunit